jgi:hypothetical protein
MFDLVALLKGTELAMGLGLRSGIGIGGAYPGCMDHMILADESETVEIQKKTLDWTGAFRPT